MMKILNKRKYKVASETVMAKAKSDIFGRSIRPVLHERNNQSAQIGKNRPKISMVKMR